MPLYLLLPSLRCRLKFREFVLQAGKGVVFFAVEGGDAECVSFIVKANQELLSSTWVSNYTLHYAILVAAVIVV